MKNFITINGMNGEITYEFAGFGERFVARLIDILIVIIPSALIPIIAPWLYFSLQHSGRNQATVGQKAMGIKVIDIYGNKVGFGQATGRFFGNILNVLTFLLGFSCISLLKIGNAFMTSYQIVL